MDESAEIVRSPMQFVALATDFDGTMALDGVTQRSTLDALRRARASGRRVLLVSGRELDDMRRVLPELELFDLAVLENGAVLYEPTTGALQLLAHAPAQTFFDATAAAGIPFSRGRVISSTVAPYDRALREVIGRLGLDLDVIPNKGSFMVLPRGVNKATGLAAAAERLGFSLRNTVAVGDAENDDVFLDCCEIGVAVANALPALRARADYVTKGCAGVGLEEFVDEHLLSDCASIASKHSVRASAKRGTEPARER